MTGLSSVPVETTWDLLAGGPKDYSVDASTLGLPPGLWPQMVIVSDRDLRPVVFWRTNPLLHGREVSGYVYRDRNGGKSLKVFND